MEMKIAKRLCLAYCTLEDIYEAYPECTETEAVKKALCEAFTEQEADEILKKVSQCTGYRAQEDTLQDLVLASTKDALKDVAMKEAVLKLLATNNIPHCNGYYDSTPDEEWLKYNL